MKLKHSLIITLTMTAIVAIAFFSSCSKTNLNSVATDNASASTAKKADDTQVDDNGGSGTINTGGTTINTANLSGNWHITYYFDKKNKTTSFNGYSFIFNTNGAVTASNGANTVSGTWSTNTSFTKFYLSFIGIKPFSELTDDWKIISQSSNKIELIHTSGGNGGTDYLTFEL